MLISKTTKTKWAYNNRKFYEPKGYIFTKYFDIFEVKIEDLPMGSDAVVEFLCDYCSVEGIQTIIALPYGDYNKRKKKSVIKKDCCKKCWHKKNSEVCLVTYGVNHHSKREEVKEKIIESQRHSYDFIKNEFSKRNLVLLSETYKNNEQKLEFICLKHQEAGYQFISYASLSGADNACRKCEAEVMSKHFRHDFEFVKSVFSDRNLYLLENEYINHSTKMKYICNIHNHEPQEITFVSLYNHNAGCYYCSLEKRSGENHYKWKGGISPISNYLREKIETWKIDSIKNSNFKCVITGKRFDDIHHLYSFNKIMIETMQELELPIYAKINEYTEDELKLITNKCIEIHYRYPLGVCLTSVVHSLFHNIYGYNDNNPEQFYEFKTRWDDGEFSLSI